MQKGSSVTKSGDFFQEIPLSLQVLVASFSECKGPLPGFNATKIQHH